MSEHPTDVAATPGYDREIAKAYFLLDSYVDLFLRGEITADQLRAKRDEIRAGID